MSKLNAQPSVTYYSNYVLGWQWLKYWYGEDDLLRLFCFYVFFLQGKKFVMINVIKVWILDPYPKLFGGAMNTIVPIKVWRQCDFNA